MRDLIAELMRSPEQAIAAMPGWLALAAVLIMSLAGSGHCAAMCGMFPLVLRAAGRNRRTGRWSVEVMLYHFGRGLAYAALGAAAGGLGRVALDLRTSRVMALAAAVAVGAVLVAAGWRMLTGRGGSDGIARSAIGRMASRLAGSAMRFARGRTLGAPLMGAASILLPCGWLYGFVAAAATTGSAWMGGLVMLAFWLGTVPAVSVLPSVFGAIAARSAPGARRVAGVLLIIAGISLAGLRLSPLLADRVGATDEIAQCH